jgi:hypothetical protein
MFDDANYANAPQRMGYDENTQGGHQPSASRRTHAPIRHSYADQVADDIRLGRLSSARRKCQNQPVRPAQESSWGFGFVAI